MEKSVLQLDNSGRATFKACKRKYYYQIIQGLQPNYGSTALRFGSCWHGIQEGYYSWVIKNGWPKDSTQSMAAISQGLTLGQQIYQKETEKKEYFPDYRNFNTAVQGFSDYLDYFKDDSKYLTIVSTEKKFECEIIPENPTEEKLLKTLNIPLIFTGKIDLCVLMDSIKWLLDFKTTGWYLDKVVAQQNRSAQLIGYSYAGGKVLDFEPQGCLVSFAYFGSTKSKVTGEYGKVRTQFRRVPQIYSQSDISAWKLSFIDTAIEIQKAINENFFPESFDNCFQYGACPYLRLCQQNSPYESLQTEGFHIDHWNVLDE